MDGEDTAAASAKLTEAGDGVEGRRRADHASTSLVRRADVDVIANGDLWLADVGCRPFRLWCRGDGALSGAMGSMALGTAGTAVRKDVAAKGASPPVEPCPPMQPGGAHEGKARMVVLG